jgi:hypothetical protein
VDLVTLPEDLPDWFREHLELEAKEKEEYQQLYKRKELDPLGILVSHISYFLWFSNQN